MMMMRMDIQTAALCLLLALCGGLALRGQQLTTEAERSQAEAERLSARVASLEAEAGQARADAERAAGLVASMRARMAQNEAERRSLERDLDHDENAQDWLSGPIPGSVRRLLGSAPRGRPDGPACRPAGAMRPAGTGEP